MSTPAKSHRHLGSLLQLICIFQLNTRILASTQFTSHVTVNTPARSFSHGVGDPLPSITRRSFVQHRPFRPLGGYQRVTPAIPFADEVTSEPAKISSWINNYEREISIPILSLSPYKVESPDPESLWPEGLFLPPVGPLHFGQIARADESEELTETDPEDPYLLEGSDAIAAVQEADQHGELFFHEIPHIESLHANQEIRVQNKLKPHRLGSIRYTWPYNRP